MRCSNIRIELIICVLVFINIMKLINNLPTYIMNIHNCDKFNVDDIVLGKPSKVDDVYVSNINFALQTPKLVINKISKKITVVLDEKMENVLNKFDSKVISLISENSEEYFEDKMEIEDAEEIYKSSIKVGKNDTKMSLLINKKLSIFNKHKEELTLDKLESGDTIICLLKCKKIVFYKSHCEPLWEVMQIKLKEIELNTKSYLFIEDPNDTHDDNDNDSDSEDSCIKKIKIKGIN